MSAEPVAIPDADRMAGLIFELASQLHIERAQRMALETALARAGVINPREVDGLACDAELRRRITAELDESMAKLMRVLTDSDQPPSPHSSPGVSAGGKH